MHWSSKFSDHESLFFIADKDHIKHVLKQHKERVFEGVDEDYQRINIRRHYLLKDMF